MNTLNVTDRRGNGLLTNPSIDFSNPASELEYVRTFKSIKPDHVEFEITWSGLSHTDGKVRFYRSMYCDDVANPKGGWVEVVDADMKPFPVPILLDSAAGSKTVFFPFEAAEGIKAVVVKESNVTGIVDLTMGTL